MADKQQQAREEGESAGQGVGPVIDPTKNVLDLVRAESKYQDGMREAQSTLQNFARDAESKLQTALRDAESKRTDQLRDQADRFQTTIANMLSKSVESTSSLVSTQLVQIQTTFNERVAKLEQFRYESVGKTSVADPALADALSRLGSGMVNMQATFSENLVNLTNKISGLTTTGEKTASRTGGQGQMLGWIVAGVMFVAALVTPIIAIISLKPH